MIVAATGSYISTDEAAWSYQARAWTQSARPPYTGTLNNKPPGIIYLFAFTQSFAGPEPWAARLISAAGLLAAALGLYALGRRFFSQLAGALAMLMFGLSMPWKHFHGGFLAHTESLLIFFEVVAAVLLVWSVRATSRLRAVWALAGAGAALGAALTFKQTALFSAAGLLLLYLAIRPAKDHPGRSATPPLPLAILLVATVMAVVFAFSFSPILATGASPGDVFGAMTGTVISPSSANLNLTTWRWLAERAWLGDQMLLFYIPALLFILQRRRLRGRGVPFWGLLAGPRWTSWPPTPRGPIGRTSCGRRSPRSPSSAGSAWPASSSCSAPHASGPPQPSACSWL